MTITALPTPPSRQDPANFATRADAFLGALPAFATEANAQASAINASTTAAAASATAASASQTAAASSAAAASASANTAASASGATAWVSGTTYALGAVVYSTVTGRTYRRLIAGAGTTDPSADTTNWRVLVLDMDTAYPTIRPSLMLDFAGTEVLDSRITFTRASEGRFYDGRTVAKAEENLLLQSQTFDNAAWTKSGATVTADSTTAPDGTTTADTLTGDGASSAHWAFQAAQATAGGRTTSVYAKAGTGSFLQIAFGTDTGPWANFDLSGGTVGSTGSSSTASIVSVGGGWYRCILTTTSTTATDFRLYLVTSGASARAESNTLSSSVFLWGAQLEQRSTVTAYTPTTTQPITNYIPVLQTAAANVARFDHNPITGESLGLLIEEQRTNLFERSQEFENAYWTKSGASIQANVAVAPDGTLTADAFVEDTTVNAHTMTRSLTPANSTTYTYSIYAKTAGRRYAIITVGGTSMTGAGGSGADRLVVVDLANGVISQTQSQYAPTITAVGNGWYRLTITFTTDSDGGSIISRITLANAASDPQAYTGDGFSGIYIWGAQLEAGAFPTSYIPTVAAQVTRNADAASMTGVNFSSWYRQDQGTLYGEAATKTNVSIFTAWDGTQNNRVGISSRSSGTIASSGFVVYGNVGQTSFSSTHAENNKVVLAYANNDVATTLNGAAVQSDTSASIPAVNAAIIGFDGVARITGHIRKIAYWPTRISNTALQALTTP